MASRTLIVAVLCALASVLVGPACNSNECTSTECKGTDGTCSSCSEGTFCTTKPTGKCGQPANGVYCCVSGSSSSTSTSSSSSSGGGSCRLVWDCGSSSQCAQVYGAKTGSAAEPDAATCESVCKAQGACTCQGC